MSGGKASAAALKRGAAAASASQKPKEPDGPLNSVAAVTGWRQEKAPLDYMLAIMNDPSIEDSRRDRMAQAAAPFVHPRAGEAGKKDAKREAAKKAGAGRFAPAAAPARGLVN